MTREQAIQLSIEKWEDIVNGEGIDEGGFNCALCKQYFFFCVADDASKCPIYELTGKVNCDGTPYEKWLNHQRKLHPEAIHIKRVECNTCKRLAKKELEFLRSLLKAC